MGLCGSAGYAVPSNCNRAWLEMRLELCATSPLLSAMVLSNVSMAVVATEETAQGSQNLFLQNRRYIRTRVNVGLIAANIFVVAVRAG